MSKLSQVINTLNPLGFAVQLLPAAGRVLTLVMALALSTLIFLGLRPVMDTLEESLGALGWTMSPSNVLEERVTLVTIDDRSLAEVGPWPWPREQMAKLVTAVDAAGAQVQLHDIYYTEPKSGDDQLLAALQSARGAVIAQVPVLQANPVVRSGQMTHPVSGISCDAAGGTLQLANTQSFFASHAGFAAIPKGHITPIISSDGAVRKSPAVVCVDGQAYPALALTPLLQATNTQDRGASISAGSGLFGPSFNLEFDAYPGLSIPLDKEGNLRISYENLPENYQAVSAVDVLNGSAGSELLDGVWTLIGVTASGLGDIVPTPYSGATPGVELQARILNSVLDVSIPYTPRTSVWLLGILSLVFSGLLFLLAGARGRWAAYGLPVAAVALPILSLSVHMQLLNSSNIWLGWLFPALYGLLAASLLLLLEQSRVRVERGRVFNNLNSYLPSDVAKEIAYTLPNSNINASRRDVTLLSADLRNFSAFGEARPPEESAAVLHFFFQRATEAVEAYGGRIHEFKGDSLLAVWDGHDATAAAQALQAAEKMQQSVNQVLLNEHAPHGLEPLALGIGIEQGPALIGSIGPAHRRSHTLLGDTVAITIRIQEMTAELAQPILLGECIARQLSSADLQSQGSYLLSGLTIPHVLFALSPTMKAAEPSSSERPKLKVLNGGRQ